MIKKKPLTLTLTALLTTTSLVLANEPNKTDNSYILRPGDKISIEIERKVPKKDYVVGPDGIFDMPLLGNIDVNNKTVVRLKEELQLRFAEYVKEPLVLLNVEKTGSMPIYVFGQVKKQGKHEMRNGTTLLDVISAAGLTNKSAKRRILLMHYGEEKPYMTVDIQKLLRGREGAINPVLKSGDRVYVSGNGKLL